MPALAKQFRTETDGALLLTSQGETARTKLAPGPGHGGPFPLHSLELLYELSFLRIFLAWEVFLEESFLRYLCGYRAAHGQEVPLSGHYFPTIDAARAALYSGRDYLLWHDPSKIVTRARAYFRDARHELIIASLAGRLEHMAKIRHRVAHSQKHAKDEFNRASMALSGRRYRGARPGRLLRDWAPGRTTPTRWIQVLGDDLAGVAFQITPK